MPDGMPFLRSARIKDEIDVPVNEFPFTIPAIGADFAMEFPTNVTFFVGENGSGKSTVIEALAVACGFNANGGSRNNVYEHAKTESSLSDALRLTWNKKMNAGFFLRAESFFNFASHIEQLVEDLPGREFQIREPYGGKSFHQMSHGESFLALLKNRFTHGMFFLDELEAALSPTRQLAFLALLHTLESSGKCQFVIATHSPILLAYEPATIYRFGQDGITTMKYRDTEHYRVTKDFLDAPELYVRNLKRS
jgi:predicted ATPase